MIRYTQGNLLDAEAEALVNTVNEVGVMGKGLALMFREAYPENARVYETAAKRGEDQVGRMLVTANSLQIGPRGGPRWIIHFPTKKHWRNPSRMEWIRDGLHDLVRAVRENHITSIAVPPLGCGAGGLEWSQVRREIDGAMADLEGVDVLVFEPTTAHVHALKREGLKKE